MYNSSANQWHTIHTCEISQINQRKINDVLHKGHLAKLYLSLYFCTLTLLLQWASAILQV